MNPVDRLDSFILQDRLIRKSWGSTKARACLLVALAGDQVIEDPGACPASILPAWLAHLTPWIDDAGSIERWPEVVRTYARLVRASAHLTEDQWTRLDYTARAIFVREAGTHRYAEVCERVALLCDRAANGDQPIREEWAEAAEATEAARATEAEAAEAAAWAASWAAARAAEAVARAAVRAAWAAAAERAAADRMIFAFFAVWEAAL